MVSQAVLGAIGRFTQDRLYEPSKLSWACKLRLDFGIRWVSRRMATLLHSSAGVSLRSSMGACVCSRPWDTSHQSSTNGPAFCPQRLAWSSATSPMVLPPYPRFQELDGFRLSCG